VKVDWANGMDTASPFTNKVRLVLRVKGIEYSEYDFSTSWL
jgi:hypothetical protein